MNMPFTRYPSHQILVSARILSDDHLKYEAQLPTLPRTVPLAAGVSQFVCGHLESGRSCFERTRARPFSIHSTILAGDAGSVGAHSLLTEYALCLLSCVFSCLLRLWDDSRSGLACVEMARNAETPLFGLVRRGASLSFAIFVAVKMSAARGCVLFDPPFFGVGAFFERDT